MNAQEVHKNDIGTVFEITVKDGDWVVDISTATKLQITFTKPGGAKLTKTATLSGDGTNGKLFYKTVAGDLDTVGTWKIQGFLKTDTGEEWHTKISTFPVFDNL